MRVLLTTLNGAGHFYPLLPLADALEQAGHEVAVACLPSFGPTVRVAGFRAFPVGFAGVGDSAGGFDMMVAALATLTPAERTAHQAARGISREHGLRWVIGNIFGGVFAEQSLPNLLAVIEHWQPAVLVRESFEFGGYLAAEVAGLPHVVVQNTTLIANDWRLDPLLDRLGATRARLGLPSDPELATLYRYLHLSFAPPQYHDPQVPLPATTHAIRPVSIDNVGNEPLPAWLTQPLDRPTVYATLGTERVFGASPYAAIIDGLRDEPLTLIVTVGREQDPAEFGPQPPHVHIERYVPQTRLLPQCDAVVIHGGWSTVIQTLSLGLPMVVLPLGNGQHDQAARCAALGVGRVIAEDDQSPEAIRAATHAVLADGRYRQRAEALRSEGEHLPSLDTAVSLVEQLARERQPILAGA